MKKIVFAPGEWENAGLTYAYSWRFNSLPVFRQESDCIVNSRIPGDKEDYDYMGLLAPETFSKGAMIDIHCSFEALGAPMILLSMRDETDEAGILRTLEYYEIVIWKNGLNVWRHYTRERKPGHFLVLGATFPLATEEKHRLRVDVREDRLLMNVDGHAFNLYLHDLTDTFRLGYTACEGYCRLYDMTTGEKDE